MTQHIEVLDEWTKCIDTGRCVDVAFMDMKKAYDTVPHKRLIIKLKSLGFEKSLLYWIEAFLSDRLQRVVVNNTSSDWSNVLSGVPQGSVIGPTLFLCYINDLPTCVKSNIKLFVDDVKLFTEISSKEDCEIFQNDLDALCEWSKKWKLSFHPQKCNILRLGKNNPNFKYALKDLKGIRFELSQTSIVKDLGVLIDDKLSFSPHIEMIVSAASKLIGLTRRTILSLNNKNFLLLYKTLIRPKLEYNNAVWWTNTKTDLMKLEGVQRRATKMLPGLKNLSYSERLKILDLPTIAYRRLRGDCIQVYKYLNNYYDVDWTDLFSLNNEPYYKTRGHSFKLTKLAYNSMIRGNFLAVRILKHWNNLPESVVCSPSLNAFKNALDKYWEHNSLKFDPEAC